LELVTGNVVTGAHTLALPAGASLLRTSGHVVGNLQKAIPAGSDVARTFEIGTGASYTPVALTFDQVTAAGTVRATTTAGDHAEIGSSGLQADRSVNRTWSLASAGASFHVCDATFNFVPGDVDPGADPAAFVIAQYNAPSWSAATVGARTATSTQAVGLTSFSDFAIGEVSSSARTLTITVVGGGTVTRNPNLPAYPDGTPVELTAVAGAGYLFDRWSGDVSSTTNPITLVMDGNKAVTATFDDVQPPSVALSVPNGGESWLVGTTRTIQWSATDNGTIANLDLDYSTDGGATYLHAIATGVPNTGSYAWVVPNTPATTARVRLTARDGAGNTAADASNANFTIAPGGGASNVVSLQGPSCLPAGGGCDSVRVRISRTDTQPIRGYSLTFTLSSELALCAGTGSVRRGSYLAGGAGTSGTDFTVTDNGAGSYTVDEVILGSSCGATAGAGTLFTIGVQSTVTSGSGVVMITALLLRDCDNAPIASSSGPPASVPIATPPEPITLGAARRALGNGGDGLTAINVAIPGTVAAGNEVRVYRKGYGNYPEYDDPPVPGGVPTVPATEAQAIGAGWQLAFTATGPYPSTVADEPPTRDFWYYVAFVEDGCGNVSGAIAITTGTLDYHLGDVTPTAAPPGYEPAGDNEVGILDISRLGGCYGISIPSPDPDSRADLDVGPTTDYSIHARPTTDNRIDFEDLILLAINYGSVGLAPARNLVDADGGRPQLVLRTEATPDGLLARLFLADNPGTVKGVHALITYPRNTLRLVAQEEGELLTAQGQPIFFHHVDEGAAGIHAAVLGRGVTIHGSGEIARLRFRGRGGVALHFADLRDLENRFLADSPADMSPLPDPGSTPVVPADVVLFGAAPNPFNPSTLIRFGLPSEMEASLTIYDISGQLVQTLVEGVIPAGERGVAWDGRTNRGAGASSGVYVVRLRAGSRELTQKISLVR
jgi:hypothetical protein